MIKHLIIGLSLALSLGQPFIATVSAATATYYYEVENRRKPHHGWKFHLLGTIHTVPITYLPPPIQKHVQNHKFVMTEKGGHSLGNNSKPRSMDESYVSEWISERKVFFGINYFSRYLTVDQQTHLKKVVAYAYPELLTGYNFRGRIMTLDDFTPNGLSSLYYSGGCRQGMDSFIEDLSKHGKALDTICNTADIKPTIAGKNYSRSLQQQLDDNRIHTPLTDPLIKHYFDGTWESLETADSLSDPILKDRNLAWLPHIVMEKNSYLTAHGWYDGKFFIRGVSKEQLMPPIVAVGCAHLLGDTGLLKLLQKQGYRIKRARVDGVFEPYMEAIGGQAILTKAQRKMLDQAIRQHRGKMSPLKRKQLRVLALRGDRMTPYDRMAIDPIIEKMTNLKHKRILIQALRGVADSYPPVKKKRLVKTRSRR